MKLKGKTLKKGSRVCMVTVEWGKVLTLKGRIKNDQWPVEIEMESTPGIGTKVVRLCPKTIVDQLYWEEPKIVEIQ